MTVHSPSRFAANEALANVLYRAITTLPSGVRITFDCVMMPEDNAASVPWSNACSNRGVSRCMSRIALNHTVVLCAHRDDLLNRVPGRYDIRVVGATLQSMQNAMFQVESSLSMGMTSVSWFQECCYSCWILHGVDVVVLESARITLDLRRLDSCVRCFNWRRLVVRGT